MEGRGNPVTNKIYVALYGGTTVTVIDGASNSTTTVAVGSYPWSVAVNPVTNKIYVANESSSTVTIIDGATSGTATVAVGLGPISVAVNPITNEIYLTNGGSPGSVTVINGVTQGATTLPAGSYPSSVTVNPVTNKIYTANNGSNNITVIDGATNGTTTVATGSTPRAAAVNAVTNKIYLANFNSSNVTVIDGASRNTTTVALAAGSYPLALAVNPVTDKVYVASGGSNVVTVIDGVTGGTTTAAVGINPSSVAVNPVTDRTYIANPQSNSVTVIDGVTNSATTLAAGSNPFSLAVNPVTDKVYVANIQGNVTVIDGATNGMTSVPAGANPFSVAVNPVTNKIYVANGGSNNVTVIDGSTNSTATVAAGSEPSSVAVNPVTNKIYVSNDGGTTVTVIDGVTNVTTTVEVGLQPYCVAVDSVTNKIYAANFASNNVTVIDGATNSTTTLAVGTNPNSVVVNSVTNEIYVANGASNTVTVIDEEQVQPIPLTTSITPLPNNETNNPTPSFVLDAESNLGTTPDNVYFQVDTWQDAWSTATGSNPTFASTLTSLQPGFHILYAYATDGQEATSTQPVSALTGAIQAYGFLVRPPNSAIYSGLDSATQGTWTGYYGTNGEVVANDTTNTPAYATVSFTGASTYTWAAFTSDIRALQRSSGSTTRIASTYYSSSSFTINVNLTDGNTHRIALYLLDWDSSSRSETISILNANSDTVLDEETFSGFHNGQYASWDVQGSVIIQVTKTGGSNAVVSGVFFDPIITSSATYSGLDTATEGTWTGKYGASGELLANDITNPPAFASVSLMGDEPYTWAASTSDVRALETASDASTRIASAYYSPISFTINLNLSDGNTHKISLYLLDWDSSLRTETISILDANSNTLLSTGPFSNFHNGEYAAWEVQGHVLIQVTKTGGANAVVSGIFFD